MSVNSSESRSADAAMRPTALGADSHVDDASITTLAASSGRQQGSLSTTNASTTNVSPLPPQATADDETEDEETESEVEVEIDMEDAPLATPPPPTTTPPLATPVSALPPPPPSENGELTPTLDEPDSEEEDEAFPPVQPSSRSGTDEETKAGEHGSHDTRPLMRHPSPSELAERESKRDGPSDEDDDEQQKQGGRRKKTHIEVEADTELVRVIAAEAKRLAAAERKTAVWNDMTEKLSHRFPTWRALQARVVWLQQVLRDPAHNEHSRMTEEMRRLLTEYNDVVGISKPPTHTSSKRRTRIGFVDPARQRRKAARTERPSLDETRQVQSEPRQPLSTESPAKKSPNAGHTSNQSVTGDGKRVSQSTLSNVQAEALASDATKLRDADHTPTQSVNGGSNGGTPPAPQPKAHDRSTLDAVVEQVLMEAAVKFAPEFRAVENKMIVWDKIAEASRGRYKTGFDVRHHIRWLVKVFRESSHPQHDKLSPTLRNLLAKFMDMTLVTSGPTAPRSVPSATAGTGETSKAAERSGEGKSGNRTPKKVQRVTIRPRGDCLLVRLVLEKRPFSVSSTAALGIWADIAANLVPPHPKITDGVSALSRFNTILKVFNDASHPNHNDFTTELRTKLAEYNQIITSFRARLKMLKGKVLQEESSDASAEDVEISKPRALGEGADLATLAEPTAREDHRQNPSVESAETNVPAVKGGETVAAPKAKYGGRKPRLPLDVEADELLMRVVLEKRPWTAERYDKTNVWNEIVAAVKGKNPRIKNGSSIHGRIKSLQWLMETPAHEDYGRLTSSLKEMLTEYTELYNKHRETTPDLKTSSEAETVPIQDSKKRKIPGPTHMNDSDDDPISSLKRSRKQIYDAPGGDESTASRSLSYAMVAPAHASDDALLLEILKTRPFDEERSDGMAGWDEVAVAVNQVLGHKALQTGASAMSRLKRLLDAFRQPANAPNSIQLTQRQKELLKLVDELKKAKASKETTELEKRIQQVLAETHSVKREPVKVAQDKTMPAASTLAFPKTGSLVANGSEVPDDDEDDGAHFPVMQIVSRSEKELVQVRQKLAQIKKQRDALRAELAQRGDLDVQAKLYEEQVNALQDEVIRLRSAAASDRASFETHVLSLEEEVASYRAQLDAQAARLDAERRVHRDELRAMVEMLQSERAAHERDTAAMLEVVHREREDRREEFVAMMNLVTRSVLQAEPAQ